MTDSVEDVGFEDEVVQTLPRERFDLRCPDCKALMRLYDRGRGPFYGCVRWTEGCRGNHMALADGSPRGIPADKPTRARRREAHVVFDLLWQGKAPLMKRAEAYRWLCLALGRPDGTGIGCLDLTDCNRLIELALKRLGRVSAWDRLKEESF